MAETRASIYQLAACWLLLVGCSGEASSAPGDGYSGGAGSGGATSGGAVSLSGGAASGGAASGGAVSLSGGAASGGAASGGAASGATFACGDETCVVGASFCRTNHYTWFNTSTGKTEIRDDSVHCVPYSSDCHACPCDGLCAMPFLISCNGAPEAGVRVTCGSK